MALLVMRDVHKRYGGVRALNGASFEAEAGEVHGLLGPNGSGKSTLNKVLTGVVYPDQGTIEIDGESTAIRSPKDSAEAGVAAVYQHLTLVPELSIEANLLLGVESTVGGFLKGARMRERARKAFDDVKEAIGPGVSTATLIKDLNPGQQQLVECAKAILREPRILVLDEATASLHRDQVTHLFRIVRNLRDQGVCVLFVSHRLDEIYELCDRATILRSGETVATVVTQETPEDALIELMVDPSAAVSSEAHEAPDLDQLEDLDVGAESGGKTTALELRNFSGDGFTDVDLRVASGEIVGLGGLQGQGQSDLLAALFGQSKTSGEVLIQGEPVHLRNARAAARAGVALVPGDRGSQGMLAVRPIQENLSVVSLPSRSLGRFAVSMKREQRAAREMVRALQIKLGRLADPISSLSGGNQQKVVIGKWLLADPKIILLDDPTKGVDVGAKNEIYELMRQLAGEGAAIIFNSSEDRELVALADRVVVLYEGRVTTELAGDDVSVDSLVAAAVTAPAGSGPEESK